MTRLASAFVLAVVAGACSPSTPAGEAGAREGAETAAAPITAEDIRSRIGVLAHDSMRGRDTPSPELDEVSAWIADEFAAFGLEPGGDDGSYLQHYPIRRVVVDMGASVVETGEGTSLSFGEDVVPSPFGATADVEVRAPVVLVRGSAEGAGRLQAAELEGRIVVLVPPRGVEEIRDPGLRPLVRGVLAGEPGAVLLASEAGSEAWAARVEAALDRTRRVVGEPRPGGVPLLHVRSQALRGLLSPAGVDPTPAQDGETEVRELPDLEVVVRQVTRTVEEERAPNVVGILPGRDPELADEYLVFSAHMDHVGVRRTGSGDSIFYGADDNASGTATVVELAQAMAALEEGPRRSVIFLLVSGEEKGLWGSAWYADHPSVPVSRIVANVNADMVGRNWSDTIVAIGKEHSDLGATLERVNAAHPELGMDAIDDRWPEENFYRRSDHFNFARKGVPVLFFFNGTHEDYHQASDEVEKIDADKTARIGRLLFWLGLEVADADERPTWNPESYREIVAGAGG